jgi:ankyrin repeat protein
VQLLLARGAAVDQKDAGGRTALLWAARSGRVDVARALLQAGAKIDVADGTGRTPLTHAAEKGHANIVAVLSALGAKGEALAAGDPAITARAAVEHARGGRGQARPAPAGRWTLAAGTSPHPARIQ